jgi:hypothetical protein
VNTAIATNRVRRAPVMVGTNSDWVAVSVGVFHSLGLRANGTLWAWGRNNFGQLGLRMGIGHGADSFNTNQPAQVGVDSDWAMVEAGSVHSFGIKTSGALFGWGANFFGQVGNGRIGSLNDTNDANEVSPVPVAADKTWRTVDASTHSLGMTTDGNIWAWGLNNFGQVGDGTGGDGTRNNNRGAPVLLSFNANTNNVATNPPAILQQPANQTVSERATAAFVVSAGGSDPLVYQWYFNSNVIASAVNPTATNSTLTITNVMSTNAGFYHVTVTNNFGQVTSAVARLTVTSTSAPVIVQQPESRSAGSNTLSGFMVTAQGAQPLSYRWRFNTIPIDPSRAVVTNATLLLTNVTGADQGFYDVVITNSFGTVMSTPAQLTVTNAPSGPGPFVLRSEKDIASEIRLGTVKLTDGGTEIPIAGTGAGQSVVLEFKDGLADPNWMPLSTNKGPVTVLIDPTLPPVRGRFYRVRVE